MDERANHLDDGATTPPQFIQFSTSAVEERHRAQLIGDVMARDIVGGSVCPLDGLQIVCDWSLAITGPATMIIKGAQSGMSAQRSGAMLRDGDDSVSIFIGRRGIARFGQNDRRETLTSGDAMVIAHARPIAIEWPDSDLTVLRLQRSALPATLAVEAAGGTRLAAALPVVSLLTAYIDAVVPLVAAAQMLPHQTDRHLAELATLVLAAAAGTDVASRSRGPAVQAARLAAIHEQIARRYADPMLTMARVAAAIGLSERSGYLVCEAAGIGFTEMLLGIRLDRAREALKGGFAGRLIDLAYAVGFTDLSHFNRRFRARFGMTPSEARQSGR